MHALPVLVRSHHGPIPPEFEPAVAAGRLRVADEWALDADAIAAAGGLVTTMHLDQIRAMDWRDGLERLLDRGGRLFLNGHVLRPFVAGLEPYRLAGRGRADLVLTALADHAVFAGIDRLSFATRRGVAGFYGRGHNPMPPGATALTGVGPARAPLDWVWRRPGGGAVFSHAGNDIWGNTDDAAVRRRLVDNIVAWIGGDGEA